MNKLIVLGAGESGLGAALLGQQQGYSVFVSDAGKILPETKIIFEEAGIKYEEENHNVNEILAGNLVVKSPGIAENTPVVQAIRNKKELPLVSEVEFASWFTKTPIIAITGSNGKTTTTSLIWYLLTSAGYNAKLVGNV